MAKIWTIAKSGRVGPLAGTVQYLLRARGYDVVVDGTIGAMTTAAIEAFQADNGLTVDGIVGNQTWPALIVELAQGAHGDAVRALQDQLRYRVLPECEGLMVDGTFGPLTGAAVRAFQTYVHDNQAWYLDEPVVVDGVAGVNMWYGWCWRSGRYRSRRTSNRATNSNRRRSSWAGTRRLRSV